MSRPAQHSASQVERASVSDDEEGEQHSLIGGAIGSPNLLRYLANRSSPSRWTAAWLCKWRNSWACGFLAGLLGAWAAIMLINAPMLPSILSASSSLSGVTNSSFSLPPTGCQPRSRRCTDGCSG